MRLLLAEDDASTVEARRICLEVFKPDCSLTVIDDGTGVTGALKAEAFDGLILDLGLPGLDGMIILEELNQFSRVPVIVVTARHIEKDRLKAVKLGVKDFINKPFDFRDLLKSVSEHFELSGKNP